jgi:hypothetical protein
LEGTLKNRHLSDREIYSMIIEPEGVDEDLRLHLEMCRACRNRQKGIEEFIEAFRDGIDQTEVDWTRERTRILSAISDHRSAPLWWRWGAVAVISCVVIVAAFVLRQFPVEPDRDMGVGERTALTETMISIEGMDEVEVPQGLLVLTYWEKEDFPQFLDFFTPIEEEDDEKEDLTNSGLRNIWLDQFPVA